MNDAPFPTDESVDDDLVDEVIQRKWDRFALPDEVLDPQEPGSPLAALFRNLTNGAFATEFDSPPADKPTTTLADASATTKSTDVADETAITEPSGQWELREGFS